MNPRILLISFLFLSPSLIFSQSADETAVKTVIEAYGTAGGTQSWSDVAKTYWILDNNTIVYSSYMDGSFVEYTADQLKASTGLPTDAPATVQQSNHLIVISGNAASITFDQVRTGAKGEKVFSHEMALLEKVDGNWKIHVYTIHRYIP